jgi:predicted amidohydrolase
MPDPIPVAIIQHGPVFLDLPASVAKAITLAEEAARTGARIVAFGETWLPGYPAWLDYCSDAALWDHAPSKEVFARLRQNSIVVPGKETQLFAQFAGDHDLTLVIGVNERVETGPATARSTTVCSLSRPTAGSRIITASSCRPTPSGSCGGRGMAAASHRWRHRRAAWAA